jgi:hypothetical protein
MNMKRILLAGLAAFAWYKYSKMSPGEKKELKKKITGEGKKLWEAVNPKHTSTPPSTGTGQA